MKKPTSFPYHIVFALLLLFSCTKDIGLVTEVEFELSEQHEEEGYVNVPLATTVTVLPEAEVEGYDYSFSYGVSGGQGHYTDSTGSVLPPGEKTALAPFSAALQYVGGTVGEHLVNIRAGDNFGLTKEIELKYTITEVPVTWTATSPVDRIELGKSAVITVALESGAGEVTTYERNYGMATGTGTLTERPGGEAVTMGEFVTIAPGSYELDFVPDALGTVVLEFDLRDGNGQEATATLTFEVVLPSGNDITAFALPGLPASEAVIDTVAHTVTVNVPAGTDLNVAPGTLTVSEGAAVSPAADGIRDFSAPVTYTVTAEDGTEQVWTVTVNRAADTTAPVIALTGADPQAITLGEAYTELGATATDDVDGDISANIVIDANAVDTALAGEYTVTYNLSDAAGNVADQVTRTVVVTAAVVPVTGITVDPALAGLDPGGTQQLTAVIAPANTTEQGIVWSSGDPAVATVDANGLVAAVAAGTAVITATSVGDPAISGTAEITVTAANVPVAGITVDPASATIGQGSAQQLTAVIAPAGATDQTVVWASSDTGIATVDANGLVTAIAVGTATITATSGSDPGISGTAEITVTAATVPVTGITVDPKGVGLGAKNTAQLTAVITPANATDQAVIWSSTDTAIVTVDATGLVTGISGGLVTITATSVGNPAISGTASVNVSSDTLTDITVDPASATVTVDSTQQLTAIATPFNSTFGVFVWSSSDTSVATVGDVTGVTATNLVTGIAVGTAVITATSIARPAISGTAEITVTAAPIPVTGITVDPAIATIGQGSAQQLTAVIAPAGATDQTVVWASSDTGIATVDATTGLVTAITEGTAVITATAAGDPAISGTAEITVTAANQLPTVDAGAAQTITLPTSSVTLTGVASDPDGSIVTYLWENVVPLQPAIISSPSMASTDVRGLVVGTYQFKLTATDNSGGMTSATVTITVLGATAPATGITVDPSDAVIDDTGLKGIIILIATITPSNATNQNILWSSSDLGVATVTGSGKVGTVVGSTSGLTTITATIEGTSISASSFIRVCLDVSCPR